jgi:hypothetical protein
MTAKSVPSVAQMASSGNKARTSLLIHEVFLFLRVSEFCYPQESMKGQPGFGLAFHGREV